MLTITRASLGGHSLNLIVNNCLSQMAGTKHISMILEILRATSTIPTINLFSIEKQMIGYYCMDE